MPKGYPSKGIDLARIARLIRMQNFTQSALLSRTFQHRVLLALSLVLVAPSVWGHPEADPGSCHFHTSSAEQHCAPEGGHQAADDDVAVVQPLFDEADTNLPEVVAIPEAGEDPADQVSNQSGQSPGTVDQFQQLEARTAMIAGIQGGLMRLGYNPGPATGMMNRGTAAAIRAFQSDQLLPVSGQPSLSLLTIIEDELANRQRR